MSELELEQWTPTPNQSYSGIKKVSIGDTIAVKCAQESEGLLLLKRIEIKEDRSTRSGQGCSPDTGYESDNLSRANECGSIKNFVSPTYTILPIRNMFLSFSTIILCFSACKSAKIYRGVRQSITLNKYFLDSQTTSDVGSLIVKEVEVLTTVLGSDRNVDENDERAALDLTVCKDEYSNIVEPLDYSLSPADEMKASIKREVLSLTGVSVLENVVQSRPPIDTILSCKDGKLGTHRIVLTAASTFFYDLFNGQRLEEIAVVILPDISMKIMTCLLHLAYTGQMTYTEDIQDEIFSAMECLIFGDFEKLSLFPIIAQMPPRESPNVENDLPENNLANGAGSVNADEVLERENSVHDSSAEMPVCSSKESTVKTKPNEAILACSHCPRTFTKKGSLQLHATKCHPIECHATVGEMQMLSFCDICDRQYKTVSRAMFCYNQHGLTRCLTCLGVFPTTEIKDHYTVNHAHMEGEDLVVQCRWCARAVSVKNSCSTIASHSSVHWQGASSGQRRQEPLKVNKSRPKKKPASGTHNRSKVLASPNPSTSKFQNDSAKLDLKALELLTESKKRHRSSDSEGDFNLSKNLKRNKSQVAKRTGKPVGSLGRRGELTTDPAFSKIMPTKQHLNVQTKRMWDLDCSDEEKSNKTATMAVDFKNLPKIIIKLDTMDDINELIRKSKNKSKTKGTHNDNDGQSKIKSRLDSGTSTKSFNYSIKQGNDDDLHKDVANETRILTSKQVNSNVSNLNLMKNSSMANVDEENIQLLNIGFEKSLDNPDNEGSTNTTNTKLSTYPMSYFPTRLKQQLPALDETQTVAANVNSNETESSASSSVDIPEKLESESGCPWYSDKVISSSMSNCQVEIETTD